MTIERAMDPDSAEFASWKAEQARKRQAAAHDRRIYERDHGIPPFGGPAAELPTVLPMRNRSSAGEG